MKIYRKFRRCSNEQRKNFTFSGAFAKLQKTTSRFVMSVSLSVCLSVRMEQHGLYSTDFHEI